MYVQNVCINMCILALLYIFVGPGMMEARSVLRQSCEAVPSTHRMADRHRARRMWKPIGFGTRRTNTNWISIGPKGEHLRLTLYCALHASISSYNKPLTLSLPSFGIQFYVAIDRRQVCNLVLYGWSSWLY